MDAIIAKLGDPYTDYLDPDELKALRDHTDRVYYGVGHPGGPARRGRSSPCASTRAARRPRQGVKAGDRLVSVNGKPTAGQTLETVVTGIRGRRGHAGDARRPDRRREPARTLTMKRARISVPAVESRMITVGGRKVGYLRPGPVLARRDRGAARRRHLAARAAARRRSSSTCAATRAACVTEAVGVAGRLPAATAPPSWSPRASTRRATPSRTDASPVAGDLPLLRAGRPQQRERQRDRRRRAARRQARHAGRRAHLRQGAGPEHRSCCATAAR